MEEKAGLWVRVWFGAIFLALIATALWPRIAAVQQAEASPHYDVGKEYRTTFFVCRGPVEGAIKPGGSGDMAIVLTGSGPLPASDLPSGWLIFSRVKGTPIARSGAPKGWQIEGVPAFENAGNLIHVRVKPPAGAVEREYILCVSIHSRP